MPTHRSTGLLVALALAVSGVLASPLLVVSAIPGGTVTDPQGDAIGGGPDIASFSACHTETDPGALQNLLARVRRAPDS